MLSVCQLYHFSCEQDSNLMGSDFDNEESGVPSIKRYWAVLYVFKFYNSNDIFFSCTVTVCPSGSSSCDIVSILKHKRNETLFKMLVPFFFLSKISL